MLSSLTDSDTTVYLRRKPLWNAIALTVTLCGYYGGTALLLPANAWLNCLGVFLLTYSLALTVFWAHEFMHDSVFKKRQTNTIGGNIVLWLNGGCYARFRDLKRWHIAHHVKNAEFSTVDVEDLIQKLPTATRRLILILEWLYFPAIAFLLQWRALTAPFWNPQRRDERLRVVVLLLLRGMMFTALGILSLKAVVLYFLSYTGMHVITQFTGAFFHTYETYRPDEAAPKRDQDYEQANTFSYVLSRRYLWLNFLLLNSGYHNAHHIMMQCPWHNLHQLDRDLNSRYGQTEDCFIDLIQMFKNYHRFRMNRVLAGCGQSRDDKGQLQLQTFYGCVGFSDIVLPV
ncbi:MAG: fatty acid desaturase [Leptolyngbyaceae cyanobacterium RM2_2_4]|nr:fatty acid desaturase [Leptolyngbyaceae cyanobacterium SM1_4_3]NJN91217.1 fatty acid desaturase [Leptolyngbyaceae cyanobacterium SL_5_14]NJO51896.1 fatty acid desaturase [Leptolyngbyaceae cyanobacterium RM2_2_4]